MESLKLPLWKACLNHCELGLSCLFGQLLFPLTGQSLVIPNPATSVTTNFRLAQHKQMSHVTTNFIHVVSVFD